MKTSLVMALLLTTTVVVAQRLDTANIQVLEEVVVEGVSTEGDTLQNFYKSNPSATTEGILSRMRGVSLIRRGAFGQEPVFRGMSNGQLNVTIDGMKMFGACTDRMDPVTIYIEPSNLSFVQAVLGPHGSEFGSTIGGTLNMKTAQPVVGKRRISGYAGTDFQSSASALNVYSAVNVSKGTSGYRASVVYRKSDNYHEGGGDEVLYSQYEKINASFAGKWALAKYDTLAADFLVDKGRNIGFPALPMDVGSADAGIFSLTYRHVAPWLFFHKLRVKAYHNTIAHSMDDTSRPDVPMHMDMPGSSRTSGIFTEGDVHIFHEHETFVKIEYYRNDLLGEMTMYPEEGKPMYMQTAPDSWRQDAGLYISQHYRLNSKNKFIFSFRGDYIHDYVKEGIGADQLAVLHEGNFQSTSTFLKNFSVYYRRNISPSLMMEMNTGYGERMPTLNERFGFYLYNRFDGYDYLGDPYLEPEATANAEITLNYLGSFLELQATAFYQQINEYIIGKVLRAVPVMTIGAKGVKSYSNFGSAALRGFDVMVLAKPAERFQWITTVKYTYGSMDGGSAVPLIPPFKSVSTLRYQWNRFDAQGEWEFATDQNHVSEIAGEQETPSYSLFNLRGGVRIDSRWKLNAGIENILDNRYREHLDWGNIMRPGRNFYLNVNFNF